MEKNHSSTDLFAGADNLLFDQRTFDPSGDDIERACRFFSIGKLQRFEKEKNIVVSHSNFFVFVTTDRGQYALKFYPADAAAMIAIEYAVNRFLTSRHFPTPAMYPGQGGKTSLAGNGRLAACFAYVDGKQAWQCIKEPNTIRRINAAALSLKNILAATKGRIPFLKQEPFAATANALAQASRAAAPYDQKELIETVCKDACRAYQDHHTLFTRQWLHNNTTLTNFLISKDTVYTLDLSHIREDYVLSDLAALIISCLFLNIPRTTTRSVIKDHLTQHKIKKDHAVVLNTLIKTGLIKEYLKNVRREKSSDAKDFLFHLKARKKLILDGLRETNALTA